MPRPYGFLFQLFPLRNRQFVAAVILGVRGVALHPVVMDFVLSGKAKQNFPEVGI